MRRVVGFSSSVLPLYTASNFKTISMIVDHAGDQLLVLALLAAPALNKAVGGSAAGAH